MRQSRFPHPMTLLVGCIVMAAVLTYLLPAGEYDRREDPDTGRIVVVAGTYHRVDAAAVGPFDALIAIPRGMIEAADVVFLVFLVGAAFAVVDRTGVLRRSMNALVRRLEGRTLWVIPVVALFAAVGGMLINMQEEFIAFIPALLVLTRRMGFDSLVAAAMSLGTAAVAAAFSPFNPFQVGIAQRLAELPLLSGWLFRIVFLLIALSLWVWATVRYARRTRTVPIVTEATDESPLQGRDIAILTAVLLTFVVYIFGLLRLGWGFNEMSALFFAMGVVVGLLGGLGISGTVEGYMEGFRAMAFAGLLIGFARAVFVVLQDGRIIDTIVHGLVSPIESLPLAAAAFGMMGAHLLIHVPVPSVSGQAVLTMPVLIPAADVLGLSRQVAVLAYQYGAGLCDLLTPTNGALIAVLIAADVPYERWLRFAAPLVAVLLFLGGVAIATGIAIGLG